MPVAGDVLAVAEPRLLVLRALGLGDLLTAVPALRALAAAFPDRRRLLAAPRALAPLAALAAPGFELVDVPAWVGASARPDPALAARLPRGALAVNLHGRGPESRELLRATAPERLIGFETDGGPAWDEDEDEVRRWCRMLAAYGIPAEPAALDLSLPGDERDPGGPTLIHPGAASAARRWPAERWAAVARGERARGRHVVLSGSAAEAPLAAAVAAGAGLPRDANRAGRTADVLALAALVAQAGRVACADTGVAHLATALRVPSVVLFGPTDPARWGPPPDRPWHRAIWAGRRGDPHADEPDAGLLAIDPADVLDALSALPAAPPRRRPPRSPAR